MRESLFRAAQLCNYSAMEETVGQLQEYSFYTELYNDTKCKCPEFSKKHSILDDKKTIIWPYPQNTADCIDRANCVDDFVAKNPHYRIVTELALKDSSKEWLCELKDDIVIFASFEFVFCEIKRGEDNYLYYRGRKCHALVNELSLGYLHRQGVISTEELPKISSILKTKIINGTLVTMSKSKQMAIIKEVYKSKNAVDMDVLEYENVSSENELNEIVYKFLEDGKDVVIRPFSSSQGTGLSFISVSEEGNKALNEKVKNAVHNTKKSYLQKYGSEECFPLTVTPFVESIKIKGCVTDFRIFVVYDYRDNCLHALPGMIRRAQVPFYGDHKLSIANAVTNLNAPKTECAIEGIRTYAITNPDIIKEMEIDKYLLVSMCKSACEIWLHIIINEPLIKNCNANFAYGSVDFLVKEENKHYVPIEINGANVGSHPAVHPVFLNCFAKATTYSLEYLGLGEES